MCGKFIIFRNEISPGYENHRCKHNPHRRLLRLLDNLSPTDKLDLISKLTLSVKTDLTTREDRFYSAFGAWDSTDTAESIIAVIKGSRIFNR